VLVDDEDGGLAHEGLSSLGAAAGKPAVAHAGERMSER
jgi:hypothetical protein